MLGHDTFLKNFQGYIFGEPEKRKNEIEWVDYSQGQKAILCPEPITFLSKLDDFSNNQRACMAEFKKMAAQFPCVTQDHRPNTFWFNSTSNGINLRPGLTSESIPEPIQMGDNAVHGLLAGQTGSGKSAMLNCLIFNLLAEYPPWELDLYLADFKKVEFSRYMNKFVTPHISACAATSEIRYVISMIQYLVDCMNARENFFARMGCQKIADFRNHKDLADLEPIVLPRMLLIVDEFQQMFLDASPREGDQIRDMLTAIVKKGRATGLHILFASQEMSQTLSRSDLSNFRIRFALNCNAAVSVDVIGNREATKIRKGSVLYNTADGTAETNIQYTVPYVSTKVEKGEAYSYFETFLAFMLQMEQTFKLTQYKGDCKVESGYDKAHKFYQEDFQPPFMSSDYIESLSQQAVPGKYDSLIHKEIPLSLEKIVDRISSYRKEFLERNSDKYFDILTLGDYTTFSNYKHDIQTLFIEYGRNKNIMAVSPKVSDIAYFEKLISFNFTTSPRRNIIGVDYKHIVYSFQPTIENIFSLGKELNVEKTITNPDEFGDLLFYLVKRKMLKQICSEGKTPFEFAVLNYRANLAAQRRTYSQDVADRMENEALPILEGLFGDINADNLREKVAKILENNELSVPEKAISENLLVYADYLENPWKAFPPTVVWVIGIDTVERIPEQFFSSMKNGMDEELLFIVMANSEFDSMSQIAKCCDYIFVGGNQSRLYERLQVPYSRKDADSISLDLQIRSIDECKSFKKYKCSFSRQKQPMIPFDSIL